MPIKALAWPLVALSALAVAVYAALIIIVADLRPAFVENILTASPAPTYLHIGFGAVAILSGALQFNTALRQRNLSLHRQLGRVYVTSIAISGCAGLLLAQNATGGLMSQTGFGALALIWLATTAMAFGMIRRRKVTAHREWMIRSYSLTLAAATLRLYLGLSVVLDIPFLQAYPVIAWLCWVPNLVLAELYVRATR